MVFDDACMRMYMYPRTGHLGGRQAKTGGQVFVTRAWRFDLFCIPHLRFHGLGGGGGNHEGNMPASSCQCPPGTPLLLVECRVPDQRSTTKVAPFSRHRVLARGERVVIEPVSRVPRWTASATASRGASG